MEWTKSYMIPLMLRILFSANDLSHPSSLICSMKVPKYNFWKDGLAHDPNYSLMSLVLICLEVGIEGI